MRQDVKALLNRVGDETFNYYDFETKSLEVDIWPIFEALLVDERVVGRVDRKAFARVALEPSEVDMPQAAEPVLQARPAPPRVLQRAEPSAGMFGRYGASQGQDDSVRDMLARLASAAG